MSRRLDYTKEYSLKEVGSGWDNCKIVYRPLTFGDLQTISDMDVENDQAMAFKKTIGLLKDSFVSGTVMVGGSETAMEKNDMEQLPVSVINDFMRQATGNLEQAS